MRVLFVVALLSGCATLPPQPWTHVGPSRVLEILVRHQCSGCHSVESVFGAASGTEPRPERSCTRARELAEGTGFCHVPTLTSMERFRAQWLHSFLEAPVDLRPHLTETMIRPDLTPAEVDALIIGWRADEEPESPGAPVQADLARGEELFQQKACGTCHQFGARGLVPGTPTERQLALAPDLQHARRRLSRATLERFILSPSAVQPTTEMPLTPVTRDEARALADFIYFASLAP